jgi:oxalate decarboxylase
MTDFTRRELFGAAAVAGGLAALAGGAAPQKGKGQEKIPRFRYALEKQKGRVTRGGSAKEATIKQLPISRGIAGVSMRLNPGGLRELHWHANAAEWAFLIKGRVRTTVLAPDGSSETNDFEPGDVWYFPRGHGHAVQGLGPGESHFILVFDNGAFSEYGTFSITDWLGLTSSDVLARTLGLPKEALARLPKEELYIVQGRVPPEKSEPDRRRSSKAPPHTHRYQLMAQKPNATLPGGEERIVSAKEFPISKTITGVILDLKPGALREPHWHPHANEWQYIIAGQARITVFGSHGRVRTEEFGPGDAGYVPQGFGHYIENVGDSTCRLLIAFDSGEYQEISLSDWLAANPTKLVADNLQLPDTAAAKVPDHRLFIVPRGGPEK